MYIYNEFSIIIMPWIAFKYSYMTCTCVVMYICNKFIILTPWDVNTTCTRVYSSVMRLMNIQFHVCTAIIMKRVYL